MPAYRVRFLVEFVVKPENVNEAIAEITDEIRNVYDVSSVAYGDFEMTDPTAEPRYDDRDEEDDNE